MKQLSDLKNVGKATLEDLHLLGIHTVEELSKKDPTSLFHELERRTQVKQDPCVWDVFAAIIHEINNFYTDFMLNFAYNLPITFDYFFRTHLINYRILICLVSIIFLWSMLTKNILLKRGQEEKSLIFL